MKKRQIKHYYVDVEYIGSIVYVDSRNKSTWLIPKDLIDQTKREK